MMKARSLGGPGPAVVLLAIVGNGLAAGRSTAFAPPSPPAYRGAGSCSATACHGDSRPSAAKVLRNEHTTWIKRDRHADAYSVLLDERSRSIAANLSGGTIPAEKDARCLACHATPGRTPVAAQSAALLQEGVGCEACHGPADRWIGPHTRWDWRGRSLEDKEQLGMAGTPDLARRAGICAGCHVGEPARDGLPARDVDHEMIAAGHPRLNFELSAYLATMSRHWRDDIGPDATADFPARAWIVGQLASAKASVDLLGDRAERSRPEPLPKRERPAEWPELSEYACYSCHHDLRDDPWRRRRQERPGSARWGVWPFAVLDALGQSGSAAEARPLADGLKELRRLMAVARPDRAEVIRAAGQVSSLLDRRLGATAGRIYGPDEIEDLLSALSSTTTQVEGWEQATQQYLGMVPLNQALRSMAPDRVDPGLAEELKRLRDSLRFPKGQDSPKSFDPARVGRRPL